MNPPPDPPAAPLTLEEVYRQHAAQVARWAARLAGPGIDVEDLVHEVFLTVHRLLPGFRGEARLTTWLYQITANLARDRRRREGRRWRRVLLGLGGPSPAAVPTPDESLERREARALLYRLLDGLREEHRTVIILFELEGLAGEEIAELVGAPLKTVWVWLHRGRAELRRRLGALPVEDGGLGLLEGLRQPLAVARKNR